MTVSTVFLLALGGMMFPGEEDDIGRVFQEYPPFTDGDNVQLSGWAQRVERCLFYLGNSLKMSDERESTSCDRARQNPLSHARRGRDPAITRGMGK